MGVNSLKGPFQGAAGSVTAWLRTFAEAEAARQVRRLDAAEARQQELSHRISRLGERVQLLRNRLERAPFRSGMTIQAALARHPGAGKVFSERHLPGCHLCAVRFDETIGEAAEAYGIPLDDWLSDLNALLS